MISIFLPFLVLFEVLILKAEEDILAPPNNLCNLPEHLGYSGLGKPIIDCDTIDKIKEPPCNIYSWGGNHPMMCCPTLDGIEAFESYSNTEDNTLTEEYGDYYGYDYQHVYECNTGVFETTCPSGSSCVGRDRCGKADFNGTQPPMTCGFDNSGEDKLCCSDFNSYPNSPTSQPPKFRTRSNKKYPCVDHTPKCKEWAKDHPDSCSPGHESYRFMRSACQKSCDRCKSEGCVDNYEKCAEWSRAGICSEKPEFMSFHCRESCGTCGFKSSSSKINQRTNGKQYSSQNHGKFTCGELKSKDKVKSPETNSDTTQPHGSICTSVVISDRFVITAAHCVEGVLKPGQNRKITIRDDTAFKETFEVRRLWKFPKFDGTSYYDIAVIELERRILYDWDVYGDSPTCLAKKYRIAGVQGLVQGYGLTEDGIYPDSLLEANVTILSNQECRRKLQLKLKQTNIRDVDRKTIEDALPEGLNKHLLCTKGIFDWKTQTYTGPCKGDDGGPLYIGGKVNKDGDIYGQTLAAINSGAAGECGSGDYPAWWTRISSYFKWIMCIKNAAKKDFSHSEVQKKCQRFVPVLPKFENQLPLIF